MNVVGLQRDSHKSAANRTVASLVDRLGGTYVKRSLAAPKDTDVVVQWGFKPTPALLNAIGRGIPYIILDLGYFDKRTTRLSVSINGFHGTAWRDPLFCLRAARPAPTILPWRKPDAGKRVIVIGQMPNDQSLRGQDIDAWMGRAAVAASNAFGLPVHKRPHPKMLNPWEPRLESIEDALEDCAVCVTWTSTVAIESLIRGVPTVAMHRGNMAYRIAPHEMVVATPDGREAWLHELSWREWDFSSGVELDKLAAYLKETYPEWRDAPLDSPRNVL